MKLNIVNVRKIIQIFVFSVLVLSVGISHCNTPLWASDVEDIRDEEDPPPRRKKSPKIKRHDSEAPVISSSNGSPGLILEQSEERSGFNDIDNRESRDVRITMTRTQPNADDDVDLQEDVTGCEDNYYRCCLCCFRITRGWTDLGIALTLVGGAVCSGVTTYATLDEPTAKIIGTVTTVMLVVGAGLKAFKTYLIDASATRTQDLRTVILESHRHRDAQERRRQNQVLDV